MTAKNLITWTEYHLTQTTDKRMQSAIREVAAMVKAGEITEARADEMIDVLGQEE